MTDSKIPQAVVLAALIALAGATGAMAASPTFDNETTHTSTTSDLVGGETIKDLDNSSKTKVVEAEVDSDDPAVEIRSEDGSTVYAEYSVSEMTQTYNDSANSTYHYNLSLQHNTAFGDIPISANSSKNVTVVYINNSSHSSPAETSITVTLQSGEDRSVDRLSSDAISAGDASTSTSYLVNVETLGFTLGDKQTDATLSSTVDVPDDSDAHTHEVYLTNETSVKAFDSEASSASSGDWLAGQSVTVTDSSGESHILRVYKGSAPSDASGSYAVYDADTDKLSITFSDDVSGTQDVTVSSTPVSLTDAFSEYGIFSGDYFAVLQETAGL